MGTNYYWIAGVCEVCHRGEPPLHIGKSSAGWVFALRIYPDRGIDSLYDWLKVWWRTEHGGRIEDEYGKTITREEMVQCIVGRSHPSGKSLSRSREDDSTHRNVRRGEGTWDYCDYEFS